MIYPETFCRREATTLIKELIETRQLPALLTFAGGTPLRGAQDWPARRREIVDLLCRCEYGYPPAPPKAVAAQVEHEQRGAFSGCADHQKIKLSFDTPGGEYSFPVDLLTPGGVTGPLPVFVDIAFRPDIPDRYFPVERILERGFAVARFCYQDIVPDEDDGFASGLAVMYRTGVRRPDEWGKIGMWAWAASRVADCLEQLSAFDTAKMAVIGHSRLGKTALWAAALDERFACAVSNDSGCSGAALSRGKAGESVADVTQRFGYWFCGNYQKYAGNEAAMPFDQHFLLAAIAPRRLCVGSAQEDEWADPVSEFLGCVAADEAYRLLGVHGLVSPDRLPSAEEHWKDGLISYHLRTGGHRLAPEDWDRYLDVCKKL